MKKLLNILKYFLLFALSMFLMWYALKGINFQLVLVQLKQANYFWIGFSLTIAMLGYFSRAYRWKMQIEPTGYKVGFWSVYNAMMVGYLANLVLPRAGEVVRCSVLKRTDEIPVKVSLGTVITERVIDLVMLLSLVTLTFFVEFDKLHDFFLNYFNDKYASFEQNSFLIYSIIGIMLLLTLVAVILLIIYLNRLRQNAFFMKMVAFVRGILEGVFSISRLKNKGEFVFHTLFVWFTYYIMGYIAFFALDATNGLGMNVALAIFVIGGLGMAAPVQGGIGIFHLMVQSTLLLYGIGKETGMAYALIVHTSQTLLVVIMGGISFVMSMLKSRRQPQEILLSDENELNMAHGFRR
ncbi:flippase-like domain-containing protein [Adhaeribacter sp. BT258]|uniref:Flippase-like domain-containing protein n=1 Tax=Adhaeribacter terrigena TaxID=2793070 RepID=A0ABS1C271_9BACT|nr:lysylphosphatidylglycerol synthase transmembrane domain-containing protein [Adhaeribacter terrigena]MBK0403494.1 flippase-like domain-containing protein [Adhaeribacter terrigena]